MAVQSPNPPSPNQSAVSVEVKAAARAAGERSLLSQRGVFTNFGDKLFYWGTLCIASSVILICLLIGFQLWQASQPTIHQYGLGFLTSKKWDPVEDVYGAWPFIFGTLASSFLALLIAVPIGIGTAIFLTELAPQWMRTPVSFLIELLAAVPSVVYGLWGIFVLVPALRPLQAWLGERFGFIPLFQGPALGYSMMAGAIILAIMVLPFITAVSREVIKAVPRNQREAAFGLGATHWEAIKGPILRYARSGIMGAIVLGLARALGETMAITMVIGNGKDASLSLFAPGNTLASALANQFAEAGGLQLPALMYIALALFGVTIIVNAIARLMIMNMARGMGGVIRE